MSLSKASKYLIPLALAAATDMSTEAHEHRFKADRDLWYSTKPELLKQQQLQRELVQREFEEKLLGEAAMEQRSIFDNYIPDFVDIQPGSQLNQHNSLKNQVSNQWKNLDQYVSQIQFPHSMADLKCSACKLISNGIGIFMRNFIVHGILNEGGVIFCDVLTHYDHEACKGLIKQQWGDAILPFVSDWFLDETNLCVFSMNYCDQDKWIKIDLPTWAYDFVKAKPEKYKNTDYVNKLYDQMTPRNKSELIKVAIISDFHLSWDYTPGMNSDCTKVLCCRSDSGLPTDPSKAAGKWGDYNCDIPIWTLETMFDYIREDTKPDAILWGGDTIPHNLDTLTFDTNVEIMKNVTQKVVEAFPDQKGKIFPAIGNHDTYPQDIFSQTENDKCFNEWAPAWLQFIDDDKNKELFKKHQYYAKQLTNNTRVLVINSVMCYFDNWNSITAFNDPGNQFQWMIEQLEELEQEEGHAIILAHVPNLEECERQWGRRLHAILDRFAHVISFSSFSHVHYEEFQVVRDLIERQPVGVSFVTSSATPLSDKNPSFDVVYLDPDTMRPVDYEIYSMDLDYANKHDVVNWTLYFDYRTGYNMTDLSPRGYMQLADDIFRYNETCQTYVKNRFIGGPAFNPANTCDHIGNFCVITAAEEEERFQCMGQTAESRLASYNLGMTFANYIQHAWYVPKDQEDSTEK